MKDSEGYLVTRNEQVWESYSEDEAPPPKKQVKAAPKKEEATEKGKKTAPKKGGTTGKQGNIMSFFKKQP